MISTLTISFNLAWTSKLNLPLIPTEDVSGCTGTDKCVWANHLNLIIVSLRYATENQSEMKKCVCGAKGALNHRGMTRFIIQRAGKRETKAGKCDFMSKKNIKTL